MSSNKIWMCARDALLREINLTPKPGLVDRNDTGAHRDMDYDLFRVSIEAITPFFKLFYHYGYQTASISASITLPGLRKIGIDCERNMFAKTHGVNTHKGAIFSLALLCCGVGRLTARDENININNICSEVSLICKEIIETDFTFPIGKTPQTYGEKIYLQYGITGARGEAASGFRTLRMHALGPYEESLLKYKSREKAELIALICLISKNVDSNIIARSGLAGLEFAQSRASRALSVLDHNGYEEFIVEVREMNKIFIYFNISPGGSADLLSALCFFDNICQVFSGEVVC